MTTSTEITHVITTYFKRPKGTPGITMLSSRKMSTEEARRWIDRMTEDEDGPIQPLETQHGRPVE